MRENERSLVDADLLRSFLAIVETGNLTRSAERLGRTQSALSVQLRKLEDVLGVRLFVREARGMRVTAEGETLLPAARKALRELAGLTGLFDRPLSGHLRIGVPEDYGGGALEAILADFAARHPGVQVSVHCSFSVTFPQAIRSGELDLAVYLAEAGEGERGEQLGLQPTLWAARRDWSPAKDEPVPLALFDRACWWRDAAIAALETASRPYRIAYSSESTAGVKAAINAGLAVGMLVAGTLDPGMRALTEQDGFPPLPPSAMVLLRNREADSPALEQMAEAIRRGLSTGMV